MTTFPSNPATALIIAEIADQLSRIDHPGLMAMAIRSNPKAAIKMLYEQIQDDRDQVDAVIGYKLVDKIEKLFV